MLYNPQKIKNDIDIRIILNFYGIEIINNRYLRCLNPNHEDKKPSMFIGDKVNYVFCSSCNAKYSVIDLIEMFEGCNFYEACKKAIIIAGRDEKEFNKNNPSEPLQDINNYEGKKETGKSIATTKVVADNKSKNADEENTLKYYNVIYDYCFGEVGKEYLNQRQKEVENYLINRGLVNLGAIRKAFLENKVKYSIDKKGYACFFFTKDKILIQRSTKNSDKRFVGNKKQMITFLRCNDKYNNWFVVEGLFDGLVLVELGFNVIILNGAKNYKKLIGKLKKNLEHYKNKEYSFLLELDEDDTGKTATKELATELLNLGFKTVKSNIFKSYFQFLKDSGLPTENLKDLNDVKKDLIERKDNKAIDGFINIQGFSLSSKV